MPTAHQMLLAGAVVKGRRKFPHLPRKSNWVKQINWASQEKKQAHEGQPWSTGCWRCVICSVSHSQTLLAWTPLVCSWAARAADLLAHQWWKGVLFLETTIQQFNLDSNLLHLQQAFVKIGTFLKYGKRVYFFLSKQTLCKVCGGVQINDTKDWVHFPTYGSQVPLKMSQGFHML